jgi:cell division septum initiation protein DivIVA
MQPERPPPAMNLSEKLDILAHRLDKLAAAVETLHKEKEDLQKQVNAHRGRAAEKPTATPADSADLEKYRHEREAIRAKVEAMLEELSNL